MFTMTKAKARLASMTLGMILVIGGGAVYVVNNGGGGGGGLGGITVANLFLTRTGDAAGSCTRSATPITYSAALSPTNKTCGAAQEFDQAYSDSNPGDTVGIPGGTLPAVKQVINFESRFQNLTPACDPTGAWGAASTVNCVHFAPVSGTQSLWPFPMEIHSGSIWIDGSHTGTMSNPAARTFSFQETGLLDTESDDPSYPDHVTVSGIKVDDMVTYGTHNMRFTQSETGDYAHNGTAANCAVDINYTGARDNATGNNFAAFESEIGGRGTITDTNIEWDHIYLHNVNNSSDSSCDPHDGCMFIHTGIDGLLLDSDVWQQCWVYDIQNQNQGSGGPSLNITIQNSWFGVGVESIRQFGNTTTPGQRGLQFDTGSWTNYLVRYNSFDDQGSSACVTGNDCTFVNVRFIGNTGAIPATSGDGQICPITGITYDKNTWNGGTCSAGDISSPGSQYVSDTVGSENFHLANGTSVANNEVTPTSSDYTVTNDIDGDARTAGSRDAGSDER